MDRAHEMQGIVQEVMQESRAQRHLSDGALIRYHDGRLDNAALGWQIERHLEQCQACYARYNDITLIHLSEEELIDHHDGQVRNPRTLARVQAHLEEQRCPLCRNWLEEFQQAEVEAAAWLTAQPQELVEASQPAAGVVSHGPESVSTPYRGVRWQSPIWKPPLAGQKAAAAGTGETHTFHLEEGHIQVTYDAWPTTPEQPTMLWLAWHADFVLAGDLWVRFTRPDAPTPPLAEIRLGRVADGERLLNSQILGFDPTQGLWALAFLLQESQA